MRLPHTWLSRLLKYNATYSAFFIYLMGTHCVHLNIHGLTYSFRPKVKFVKGLKSKCKEMKEETERRKEKTKAGSSNAKRPCGQSRGCLLPLERAPFAF